MMESGKGNTAQRCDGRVLLSDDQSLGGKQSMSTFYIKSIFGLAFKGDAARNGM